MKQNTSVLFHMAELNSASTLNYNCFPIALTILAIVLGSMLEEMFLSSMIKADGELLAFFSRPIAATLGVLTILIWLVPLIKTLKGKLKKPAV